MLVLASKMFNILPWQEMIPILIKVQIISSLHKNKNNKAAGAEAGK